MCGIVGIISKKMSLEMKSSILSDMNKAIYHRGPDDSGQHISGDVGIGMRRLSILDLGNSGHQPMHLENYNLSMVYNGEIYNYKELKAELIGLGHKFVGLSDSEVVIHAYAEWKNEAFSKFNGMFAIAIWNSDNEELILCRDRCGEKPLFYWEKDSEFAFSSEMKALFKHPYIEKNTSMINKESLYHYLILNSPPSPSTLLSNIKQVSPGEILSIKKGDMSRAHYWIMPELEPDYSITESKAIKDIEELLEDSIHLRLRSDVPVGVFLSGGVDSSLIASISSKSIPEIKTFAVGYDNAVKADESIFAQQVADHIGTKHETIIVKSSDLDVKSLISVGDDPLANQTIIPYLKLAEQAAKEVKVVLSGDGGDEFFCGYSRRLLMSRVLKVRRYIPKQIWNSTFNFGSKVFKRGVLNWLLRVHNFDSEVDYLMQFQIGIPLDLVSKLVGRSGVIRFPDNYQVKNGEINFHQLNYHTATTYLTDTVLKTSDRATMHHSIESRTPFTDHRLIEAASIIPQEIHFKNGTSKYILKKILSKYLPESMINRPKKGFGLPGRQWLNEDWSWLFDTYLTNEKISASGVFDPSIVEYILEKYKNKGRGFDAILWRVLIFQLWWDTYIED